MENGASSGSSDPSSFLTEIIGAPVKVKLNSSVEYRGQHLIQILQSCTLILLVFRIPDVRGRLYEHLIGEDGGVCGWQDAPFIWGGFRERK